MNQISYDHWQAMIRLPYLAVLAFWMGQRARLYSGQIKAVLRHLAKIKHRDLDSVLGQLADDSAAELLNLLKGMKAEDISHFQLQCARVVAAAQSAMSASQFQRYLAHHQDMLRAMYRAVPWYARVLNMLRKPLPADPRLTLLRALDTATPAPSLEELGTA